MSLGSSSFDDLGVPQSDLAVGAVKTEQAGHAGLSAVTVQAATAEQAGQTGLAEQTVKTGLAGQILKQARRMVVDCLDEALDGPGFAGYLPERAH